MKKLQNKILLIFFIIGTIIIIGMGAFFAGIVGETQDFIGTSEYVTSQDLINITDTQMNQAKILILGTILVFSCIVIVVGIFISEAIVKPLNKMIINAQKLANGESVELIELKILVLIFNEYWIWVKVMLNTSFENICFLFKC